MYDNEGSGISDGRTQGLQLSTSDIVAFIDDDAWAEPDWLTALVNAFRQPHILGVGGHIVPEWEAPNLAIPSELYWVIGSTYRGHRETAGPISRPIGANMAVRREPFIELGGFSSVFGRQRGLVLRSNEELAAFSGMTKRFGADSVQYVPTARVHHFVPRERCSFRYVIRRSKAEGLSKADVRQLRGRSVMGDDRHYAYSVLPAAVASRMFRGMRGDFGALRGAAMIVIAFTTTCCWYLARSAMSKSWPRIEETTTTSVVSA
jgi:glycosyltransferase involved in cell wall biosynthesis